VKNTFALAFLARRIIFVFQGGLPIESAKLGESDEVIHRGDKPMSAATAAPTNIPWQTHKWTEPDGRRVEIERGKPLTQRYCQKCGRTFVEDHASKERYAVHVSAIFFKRLIDDVNQRWLSAPCPGQKLETDSDDEKKWSGQDSEQ
jgi:hypothetical protein